MKLEKMFDIRSNNTNPTWFSNDDSGFYNTFVEYIKNNSKLLDKSIIVEGKLMSNYCFDIENNSKTVHEGEIKSQYKPVREVECIPKLLCSEFGISKNKEFYIFKGIDEEKELQFLEKTMYQPFLRSIEKNVISGNYFDKSLFETSETITGTIDFSGLLKLIRNLKEKNENNYVVINPSVINKIIDTIIKEGYLNEYLLNGTIEGVKIITTLECPNNKIVGFDPKQICLTIVPELQIRKLSCIGLECVFQVFCFVNGGDMFSTSIGMDV